MSDIRIAERQMRTLKGETSPLSTCLPTLVLDTHLVMCLPRHSRAASNNLRALLCLWSGFELTAILTAKPTINNNPSRPPANIQSHKPA